MKTLTSIVLLVLLCALPIQSKKTSEVIDEEARRFETYDIRKLSCSACLAVVWEFGALLSQETTGADYVNGKGEKIAYRKSEMRATLILEKLCPLMKGYGLFVRDTDNISLFRRIEDHHHGTDHLGSHKLKLYCEDLLGDHEDFFETLVKLGEGLNAGDMEALAETVCVTRVKKACKTKEEALDKMPYRDDYIKLQEEAEKRNAAAEKEAADAEAKADDADQLKEKIRQSIDKFGGSYKTAEEKSEEL